MPPSWRRGSRAWNPVPTPTCSSPTTRVLTRTWKSPGRPTGLGPLGLGGDRFGSARVQPVLVGTLVVDISDARTRAIVWRSLASSDIRPTDKPESRDKKIAKATEKMFKNYPPKP